MDILTSPLILSQVKIESEKGDFSNSNLYTLIFRGT